MTFNLLIPEINKRPKNTKDAVISILTLEWPLTLMKIYYQIKKMYGFSKTYQSVYKAVNELLDKKVLIEEDKGYKINISWVKNLQSFTKIVETNYYSKERMNNLSGLNKGNYGEDVMIVTFKSVFDAEKYLYYFIKSELLKKKNQDVFYKSKYEWRPLFYLRAEYNYFTKLKKRGHKFYFLSSGVSSLEDFSRNFYKKIKINVKNTKKLSRENIIVFSDYFIQIFIPNLVEEKMRNFLEKKDLIGLMKILDTNGPVKIIIHKDKSLSDEMKKQLSKSFKN